MTAANQLIEIAKRFIEHAPPAASSNPDLLGFNGNGVNVCEACAGRIIARGCDLKFIANRPVWADSNAEFACDVCQKT